MALLEIERNIYLNRFCDDDHYLNKLLCYEALGREEDAIFDDQTKFPSDTQKNEKIKLKIAKLYYEINNSDDALTILQSFQNTTNTDILFKNLVLQGIISVDKNDYKTARTLFSDAEKYDNSGVRSAKNLLIIDDLCRSKKKNANIARALSIVPGGGYLYTKNYKNALTALLINAAIGYATYSSINSKNYGMAV